MTREEAKETIKYILKVMPKEPPTECDNIEEWLCEDDEIRKALDIAIKSLEQEPTTKNNLEVDKTDMIDKPNFSQEQYKADLQSAYDCGKPILDKIRAEIKALPNANPSYWYSGDMVDRDDVLEIIDEYRAESEGE